MVYALQNRLAKSLARTYKWYEKERTNLYDPMMGQIEDLLKHHTY